MIPLNRAAGVVDLGHVPIAPLLPRSQPENDPAFSAPGQDYWEHAWKDALESEERRAYLEGCWIFDRILSRTLPMGNGLRALEIGCHPGGFMSYLHRRFGYRVSGLDYVAAVQDLPGLLRVEGVPVEGILHGDFWAVPPEPAFDVVASFGFVEHFHDPAQTLRRQAAWVAPGGWLVAEVPNFNGLQHYLHRGLDLKNLSVHNLGAMSRVPFLEALQADFDMHYLAFFGTFAFWCEADETRNVTKRTVAAALRKLSAAVLKAEKATRLSLPNRWSSPFLVCVAKRRLQ